MGGSVDGKKLERIVIDPIQVQRKINEFQNLVIRYGKTIEQVSLVLLFPVLYWGCAIASHWTPYVD